MNMNYFFRMLQFIANRKCLPFLLFVCLFSSQISTAQVTVSGSTRSDDNTTYTTLHAAINALGWQNGTNEVVITISGSTTEMGDWDIIGNTKNWGSLKIYPTTSGCIISGSVGGAILRFEGAHNVTVDGRVNQTGNADMTIVNNSTADGASAIQFYNGSHNNTIKYCNIKGANPASNFGIIFFAGSYSDENGDNSYNEISNCNITTVGSGTRVINAIYSQERSGHPNHHNSIINNNIYNTWRINSDRSHSICINAYSTDFTITGNSIYETTAFNSSADAYYSAIYINTGETGNNFNVSDNYIGGSSTQCGGSAFTMYPTSEANPGLQKNDIFYAIYLNVGTSTTSSVQGNVIRNISSSNTSSATPFYGIKVDAGNVNIGTTSGNIIGNSTGTGSIYVAVNSKTGATTDNINATMYGIYIGSNGNVDCRNNTIGSVSTANTTGNTCNIVGIYKAAVAGTTTISNNTIGSATEPNSIFAADKTTMTDADARLVCGIMSEGTGNITFNNNTIANLKNGTTSSSTTTANVIYGILSTNGTNTIDNNIIRDLTISNSNLVNDTTSVGGIILRGETSKTVRGNTIYNLSNTNSFFSGSVVGLLYNGNTSANTISKNFIHSLSVRDVSENNSIFGIKIASGASTLSNNIISIGVNSKTILYGIYDSGVASQNTNLYHNTVNIFGLQNGGTANSYALYSAANANVRDFRNNIFNNNRTNESGSGAHYSVYCNYSSAGTLTINYNDYIATRNGAILGYFGATKSTLSDWKLATAQDENSLTINPLYSLSGSTFANDFMPSSLSLNGISGLGVTEDFGSNTRVSLFTIGAFESYLPVQIYNGATLITGYPCLRVAFEKINDGTHTNDITIKLTGNSIENAPVILNASGQGAANYSSINIFPTITGLAINGDLNSSLIELNGADNVTFDGRVNATGNSVDLSIVNSSTGTSASTFSFDQNAQNNNVRYCTIKGASLGINGTMYFADGNAFNGNGLNTISQNIITNVSGNRPIYSLVSGGSSTYPNTGNIISNNEFKDFLNPVNESAALYIRGYNPTSGTNSWTISGNSFYETTTFSPVNSYYSVIKIGNSSSNVGGQGYTITDNFIGGSSKECGGTWNFTNNQNFSSFSAISFNLTSIGTTNLQNNTIKNINYSNTGGTNWKAIEINNGAVNIGTVTGNTIGAPTGTGSLTVTGGSGQDNYNGSDIYGIYINAEQDVDCRNNVIGSFTTSNTDSRFASHFYGIFKNYGAGNTTFSNNTIGSEITANSINATGTSISHDQHVYGILNRGNGNIAISNNTIANLRDGNSSTNSANQAYINGIRTEEGTNTITNNTIHDLSISDANNNESDAASTCGISITKATNTSATGNTIYNLSNTYSTFGGKVIGMYLSNGIGGNDVSGNVIYNLSAMGDQASNASVLGLNLNCGNTTENTVNRNFIHSLSVPSSTTSRLYGIGNYTGKTTYANNIISISENVANTIYGIFDNGDVGNDIKLYFNTIYIGGSLGAGFANLNTSYCLYGNAASNNRDFRNNVFSNAQSTAEGENLHYAVYFNYPNNTNLNLNYNDYFVSGTGGTLGFYNGVIKTSLPIVPAKDANSLIVNPSFDSAGSTVASNYNTSVDLVGTSSTGIITDYNLSTRNTFPVMGAWERLMINKWLGSTDTNWNTASNWTMNSVPATSENIIIHSNAVRDCKLSNDYIANNIVSDQSNFTLQTNGYKLSIKGDINLTNGAKIAAASVGSTVELAGEALQTIPAASFVDDNIYNLTINNASNVKLSGTLNLLNSISNTSGKLDASTNSPSFNYSGSAAQSIGNEFLNNKVYNLGINNSAGVMLNQDFSVENKLTVNSGKITIPTEKQLNVIGTISNNVGVNGIVVKASPTGAVPNGTLIFHNTQAAGQNVPATVEMYSLAFQTQGIKKWQFFGIPLRSILATPTFDGSTVREMHENVVGITGRWESMINGSVMTSFTGYEISQPSAKVITFRGDLENKDFGPYTLTCTSTATYKGEHLIANPYTAAIDIKKIQFGSDDSNVIEKTIYLYNTGSNADWTANGGTTSNITTKAGQYNSVPLNWAGVGGIPAQVPSMQAFMVGAKSVTTISIPYSSAETVTKNTEMMRTKNIVDANKTFTTIDVIGSRFSDKLWLFTEQSCTPYFDNGWDGPKAIGSAYAPQLYAIEADGIYQVNSVSDINNTELGFQAGEDTNYTLTFTHQNTSIVYPELYLVDLKESKTIDISQSGTQYSFTATPTTAPEKRFKIITSKNTLTKLSDEYDQKLSLICNQKTIIIQNKSDENGELYIYDITGRFIQKQLFSANNITTIPTNLSSGSYIVKAITKSQRVGQNLIFGF
jgi:hypothetical protein